MKRENRSFRRHGSLLNLKLAECVDGELREAKETWKKVAVPLRPKEKSETVTVAGNAGEYLTQDDGQGYKGRIVRRSCS